MKFRYWILMLAGVAVALFVSLSCFDFIKEDAGVNLKPESKYKVLKSIYLKGVYNSLNDRTVSKSTARAFLIAEKHYKKAEVAFLVKVPQGTIVSIIEPIESAWDFTDRYLVTLSPDLSRELDVVLPVNRGLENEAGGLNTDIFSEIK